MHKIVVTLTKCSARNALFISTSNMILKAILCFIAILGAIVIGLVPCSILSSGRQSGAPIALFVPLTVFGVGYYAQRRFHVGLPVAIWTMIILETVIIAVTLLMGGLMGDVATISVLLGAPWIVGIIFGRKVNRNRENH